MPLRFNYIITIHNKEELIERVLTGVAMCARDNSHIYAVLDGCTDGTEAVIDRFVNQFSSIPLTKVYADDVHELLSINAGLQAATHDGEGFNIVLQDDVILADFLLEKKIASLYEWGNGKLGYVSLRFGANFSKDAATSIEITPLQDYAENAYSHYVDKSTMLLPGQFMFKHVPIKSPVCIPFFLIREVGVLEPRLAPYAHDDTEYAIRCIKAGYKNGVFAVRFTSELKWGGTRDKPHPSVVPMLQRNIQRIRVWHQDELEKISASGELATVYDVIPYVDTEDREMAKMAWHETYSALESFYARRQGILYKLRNMLIAQFKMKI